MQITLSSHSDLNLEMAWRVGFEGYGVRLSDRALESIDRGRAAFDRLVAKNPDTLIYGTTTGPGSRGKTLLDHTKRDQQGSTLAQYIPLGVGAGGQCLPQRTCRLITLARLTNIVSGQGKVSAETAIQIADMLNRPLVCIPFDSATGPGEVLPLSHLLSPIADQKLAPGEAMALVNGAPCAAGIVAETALSSRRRLELAVKVFALSIVAARAPFTHFDPDLAALSPDPNFKLVLAEINGLLWGADDDFAGRGQAPVSWRVLPNVLATAFLTIHWCETVASQSLVSVSDNPVFVLPNDEHPDGRVLTCGGFHNHQAGRAVDGVNASWADLTVLATKHVARLLDSHGMSLPPLLVPEGSGLVGMEFLAWIQESHGNKAVNAAAPALLPLGLEDPQGGQQDVAVPAFIAYERHLQTSRALDEALSTLAVTASQALLITGRQAPPRLRAFHKFITSLVPFIDQSTIGQLGDSLGLLRRAFSGAVRLEDQDAAQCIFGHI